jgi:hypothetical protein
MVTENNRLKQWENKYHECLALEFNNPKYFEVHHLLVLTYMLQTDSYSSEYLPVATDLLKKFLNELITPQDFLDNFEISKTNQNVENNSSNRNTDKFKWNINILDVKINEADVYFQDVRLWANDVLAVIESI